MDVAEQILTSAESILLVDWPAPDVPGTLTRAGYTVFVKGGPGPADYAARELRGDQVVSRPGGQPPAHVDLVYAHRPVSELPGIVELASRLGARAVWHQSGRASDGTADPRGCWLPPAELQRARAAVATAGLLYLAEPYIAGEVRRLAIRR